MTRFIPNSIRQAISPWLRQGISPRRLALTLALGFAIGCIPVVGIPTVLCAALALALKLNMPAIQAANYAAMPLQVLLIYPFVRLGSWMFGHLPWRALQTAPQLHGSLLSFGAHMGSLAGQALLAWVLVSAPAVLLLTLTLTLMLRRIPAFAAAEAAD
jgi:uncharacterized protein (DUF2062 family)